MCTECVIVVLLLYLVAFFLCTVGRWNFDPINELFQILYD